MSFAMPLEESVLQQKQRSRKQLDQAMLWSTSVLGVALLAIYFNKIVLVSGGLQIQLSYLVLALGVPAFRGA